jgi:hypothetical protein
MEEFFHCVFSSIVGGQTNFSDRIKSTVYISVLTIFVDNSYYIGGEIVQAVHEYSNRLCCSDLLFCSLLGEIRASMGSSQQINSEKILS